MRPTLEARSPSVLTTMGGPRRCERCPPSYADLSRLYLARLAGFLPAMLPGTTEGAELMAVGLGLTVLGFLASRLLRFRLLAMLFSTAVEELGNSDVGQLRKACDHTYRPFLPGRWRYRPTSPVVPPADHRCPV
jgi:hypothetical protein